MESLIESAASLTAVKEESDKIKVAHTFYLNAHGNISISKRMCDILELGSKYNLVLVQDEETGKYLLELRNSLN
ncbi:hypothetical protein [Deinococcus saxicola]|jgi:hypothetical protein|uniref:hypothetical protein n=1 Tax=Deinococcus saxicola TaxID=249406 RepID=UPI0039EEB01E